jgi:6-phospho-beta-galactosidase
MDWVGVNYYMSWWIDLPDDKTVTSYNTTGDKGKTAINFGNMYKIMVKPNVSTTLWDWPIYPKGLEDLIKSIYHKYHFKKDLYITENGIGNKEILSKTKTIDDDYRIDYVKKHLLILKKLIKQNYPIAGYYLWSHTDCLSWTNGYDKRYGMFYVDWKTQKRYLKKFAYWWKIFVDKNINKWF